MGDSRCRTNSMPWDGPDGGGKDLTAPARLPPPPPGRPSARDPPPRHPTRGAQTRTAGAGFAASLCYGRPDAEPGKSSRSVAEPMPRFPRRRHPPARAPADQDGSAARAALVRQICLAEYSVWISPTAAEARSRGLQCQPHLPLLQPAEVGSSRWVSTNAVRQSGATKPAPLRPLDQHGIPSDRMVPSPGPRLQPAS